MMYSLIRVDSVMANTEHWSYSGLDIYISVPANMENKEKLLRILSDTLDEWMDDES